jgi:hypothetical protein
LVLGYAISGILTFLEFIMGGIYGKLTITAFILFVAIQVGFIIMCAAFGRRNKNVLKP